MTPEKMLIEKFTKYETRIATLTAELDEANNSTSIWKSAAESLGEQVEKLQAEAKEWKTIAQSYEGCLEGIALKKEREKVEALTAELDEAKAKIERLTARGIEDMQHEIEELRPYRDAIREAHNGYTAKGEGDNPVKEPATPQQAMRELNAEWEHLIDIHAGNQVKAESELAELKAKLLKTADGVCVVPGMSIWVEPAAYANASPGLIEMKVERVGIGTVLALSPDGRQRELVPHLWFSTPEAREAAAKGGEG